jgi:transposase-like protein
MAHRKYGRFTPELREDAIRRVREPGGSVNRVAIELGIDRTTLWGWVNAARLEEIDPAGELTGAAQRRIRDLEREVAMLKRDVEFEKKARAFARELDQDDSGSN